MSRGTDQSDSDLTGTDDLGDEESEMVLRRCKRAEAFRKSEEMQENLDRINVRVQEALNRYKSISGTSLEYVDDADQLLGVLADPRRRKKYQEKVSVFVVGAEDNVAKKTAALSSLNEVFSERVQSMSKDPDYNTEELLDEEDEEDSVYLAEDARLQVKSATQRLHDINTSYSKLFKIQQAFPDGRKGRKKLEKALLAAQDDIEQLGRTLASTQQELTTKSLEVDGLQEEAGRRGQEMKLLKDEVAANRAMAFKLKDLQGELQVTQLQLKTARETSIGDDIVEEMKQQIEELELSLAAERQSRESFHEALMEDHRNEVAAQQTAFEEKLRLVTEQRDRLEDQLKSIAEGESEAGSLNSRLDLPEDISPMDNRQETPEARDGLGASDYDQSAAVERDPEELKAVEASPAGAADLLSEEAHASDPVVSDGVRASPAASSASRHSMVEEQPEISKEQLLHEMVKSLQQELTTERDKNLASKRRFGAMKAQLAEADHRIVNISSELLELKEFHSNLPPPPDTRTAGFQFPSSSTTPTASRRDATQTSPTLSDHDVVAETATDDDERFEASASSVVKSVTVCDAETQTDSIFTVEPASPSPPFSSPRSSSPLKHRPGSSHSRPHSSLAGYRGSPRSGSVRSKSAHSSMMLESTSSSFMYSRLVSRTKSARSIAPVSVVTGSAISIGSEGSVQRVTSEIDVDSSPSVHIDEGRPGGVRTPVDPNQCLYDEFSRLIQGVDRFKQGLVETLGRHGLEDASVLQAIPSSVIRGGAGLEQSLQQARSSCLLTLTRTLSSVEKTLNLQVEAEEKVVEYYQQMKHLEDECNELRGRIQELVVKLTDRDELVTGTLDPDDKIKRQRVEIDQLKQTVASLRQELADEIARQTEPKVAVRPLYDRMPVGPYFIKFNRNDAKVNERKLYQGVLQHVIDPEEYSEVFLAMREYNRLSVEQLHKMAERRLLREKMARNAAHFSARPSPALLRRIENSGEEVHPVDAMNAIISKHEVRLAHEGQALSALREEVGLSLNELLTDLQEKSDLLFIKPVVTFSKEKPVAKPTRTHTVQRWVPELTVSTFSNTALPQLADRQSIVDSKPAVLSQKHGETVPPPPTSHAFRQPGEYQDHDREIVHRHPAPIKGKKKKIHDHSEPPAFKPLQKTWSHEESLSANCAVNLPLCHAELVGTKGAPYSFQENSVSATAGSLDAQCKLRKYHRIAATYDKFVTLPPGAQRAGTPGPYPPANSTADINPTTARRDKTGAVQVSRKANVVPSSHESQHLTSVDGRIPVLCGQVVQGINGKRHLPH